MTTKTRLFVESMGVLYRVTACNNMNVDERLDEQLDTGGVQFIMQTDPPSPAFDDFCPVWVEITDKDGDSKSFYFCGFDTIEKRGKNYYIHNMELVEPTRMLMGAVIEGKKVTQPIDGSGEEKKTLYEVVESLLKTFETCSYNDDTGTANAPRFTLTTDERITSLLKNTPSPEFHWEAETLLWECLCDIGNVINGIPRLALVSSSTSFAYTLLTFDLINEITGGYEI